MHNTRSFWIFDYNLFALIHTFSHLLGYDLEPDELDIVKYGLSGTSDDRDIWYDYSFTVVASPTLRMARDEENRDIIFVHASFEESLEQQIDLLIYLLQEYNITPPLQ